MATTWILVADQARARLFSLDPTDGAAEGGLREIAGFVNPEGRITGRPAGAPRPPRTQESVGGARHAIEPRSDLHDIAARRFAGELTEELERGRVDHLYDTLVLVAPPRFLGQLKHSLGRQLQGHLVAEIAKDLSKAEPAAIRRALPRQGLAAPH